MSKSMIAAIVVVTGCAAAQAQVLNGGFENPVLNLGEARLFATGSTIGGVWTVLGSASNTQAVFSLQATYGEPGNSIAAFNPQEGLNAVDLSGSSNQGLLSGVRQTIATAAGQPYQLSFYVGRAAGGSVYSTPATVDLSINGGVRTPFTNSNLTAGAINWQQFTANFTATGPSTVLDFFNGQTSNNYSGLDNVAVTAVPEPSSTLALVAGLLAVGRRRISLGTRC